MTSTKLAFAFSIPLVFGGIGNLCGATDFRSDMLEDMSHIVSVDYPAADTTVTVPFGSREITVRTAGGCVEHIGFSIFTPQMRQGLDSRIADFVERYWLSLTLPLEKQKSVATQMSEDRFVFETGNPGSIGLVQKDPTLRFSFSSSPKEIKMSWNNDRGPVCAISFPVNHELILGRKMLENDRRLPQEINATRLDIRPPKNVHKTSSVEIDSVRSIVVCDAGCYIDATLKSDRYMRLHPLRDWMYPIFDADHYPESIANLFTEYCIEKADGIALSINHQIFGLKVQPVETTVRKFVAYAMQNGCTPYVGILSINKYGDGNADVLVIMHNESVGYNHILRATVPLECISTGKGTVTARLNAFVPSSNIKNLFKN